MGNVVRTVLSLLFIALNLTMKCEWLQKAVGGTIGGIKVYVHEKFSCKCRNKCRLPFFSYPQFLSFSIRIHDSRNVTTCTECTFVGDLVGNFS